MEVKLDCSRTETAPFAPRPVPPMLVTTPPNQSVPVLKPEQFAAHYNRGVVRLALGELDAAIADFDRASRNVHP